MSEITECPECGCTTLIKGDVYLKDGKFYLIECMNCDWSNK